MTEALTIRLKSGGVIREVTGDDYAVFLILPGLPLTPMVQASMEAARAQIPDRWHTVVVTLPSGEGYLVGSHRKPYQRRKSPPSQCILSWPRPDGLTVRLDESFKGPLVWTAKRNGKPVASGLAVGPDENAIRENADRAIDKITRQP